MFVCVCIFFVVVSSAFFSLVPWYCLHMLCESESFSELFIGISFHVIYIHVYGVERCAVSPYYVRT